MSEDKENPRDSSTNNPEDEANDVNVEDAFEAEQQDAEESIPAEMPQDFDPDTRTVAADESRTAKAAPPPGSSPVPVDYQAPRRRPVSQDDAMGDADGISTSDEPGEERAPRGETNWDRELSTQRIALELRRIENEVRRLLEDKDPKRKRRLAGTRRWLELEEDILSLTYTGRIEEGTLRELQDLVIRRHYLFGRLRFLASTRPTWNS